MVATMKGLIQFRNRANLDEALAHEVEESHEFGMRIQAAYGDKLDGWIEGP